MKNIKRFAVILLTICAVLVCASCKKCSKDKPQLNPVISNPNETFLKVYLASKTYCVSFHYYNNFSMIH